MNSKLTLRMDKAIIARAKQYAQENHTSVSQLIERYFDRLTKPVEYNEDDLLPEVREMLGMASKWNLKETRTNKEK